MQKYDLSMRELINNIEKKDRRFRIAQSILMTLILTSIIAVMTLLFSLVVKVNDDTTQLTNYLRCISLNSVNDRTTLQVSKCFDTSDTTPSIKLLYK